MRRLDVRCDNCGRTQDEKRAADHDWVTQRIATAPGATVEIAGAAFGPGPVALWRPLFWLVLEDVGIGQRSGPLDFCSHQCLAAWCVDAEVRQAFADDYREEGTS